MKLFSHLIVATLILFVASTRAQDKKDTTHHESSGHHFEVKELEAFHDVLHPLVHDAHPAKEYGKIKAALPDLISAGSALRNAALPKGFGEAKKFKKQAKKLMKELNELNKQKDRWKDEAFAEKFMDMHDTFEKLVEMME